MAKWASLSLFPWFPNNCYIGERGRISYLHHGITPGTLFGSWTRGKQKEKKVVLGLRVCLSAREGECASHEQRPLTVISPNSRTMVKWCCHSPIKLVVLYPWVRGEGELNKIMGRKASSGHSHIQLSENLDGNQDWESVPCLVCSEKLADEKGRDWAIRIQTKKVHLQRPLE